MMSRSTNVSDGMPSTASVMADIHRTRRSVSVMNTPDPAPHNMVSRRYWSVRSVSAASTSASFNRCTRAETKVSGGRLPQRSSNGADGDGPASSMASANVSRSSNGSSPMRLSPSSSGPRPAQQLGRQRVGRPDHGLAVVTPGEHQQRRRSEAVECRAVECGAGSVRGHSNSVPHSVG